jgi:hypothetical protein
VSWVIRHIFLDVIFFVKQQCCSATMALVDELKAKFHAQVVMDVLGIIYPQY